MALDKPVAPTKSWYNPGMLKFEQIAPKLERLVEYYQFAKSSLIFLLKKSIQRSHTNSGDKNVYWGHIPKRFLAHDF